MSYRAERQEVAGESISGGAYMPCSACRGSTLREMLAQYGGRCRPCYDAYCAEVNPSWLPARPLTHDERASIVRKAKRVLGAVGQQSDPRAWAKRLQERHQSGERLTRAQVTAYRGALHLDGVMHEEAAL